MSNPKSAETELMESIPKHRPAHPDLLAALAKYADRVNAVDAMRDEMANLMKGARLDEETTMLRTRLLHLLVMSLKDATSEETHIKTLIAGIGVGLQFPLMARPKNVELTQETLARIASDALAISLGIKTSFVEGEPEDIDFPSGFEEELLKKLDAMERVFPLAIANMKAGVHVQPLDTNPNVLPE